MVIRPDPDEFIAEVKKHLPLGFDFEVTARLRGAFTRAREVKSATALFQLAMAYGGCGMSLRETCAWAAAVGLADLADTSLLDRLCKAAPWLGDIVAALISHRLQQVPVGRWAGYRLRALDGTSISEPGADGTTWRLHVGYDLASGQVDQITLTDVHGAENLQRLAYQPGDIVLADRGYAHARDLRPLIDAGAHFIVRMGWNALRLLKPDDGTSFDLFAALAAQTGQEGEVAVSLDDGLAAERLQLRLVIRRKSDEEAEADKKRLIKAAKRKGKTIDPRSLQAAHYIMLLTALPADVFPVADVLALYRFRWQIELAFKRMKSLAGLDQLEAKKPELAQAWIYAKLIAYLIAEQDAGQVPDSPPCGPARNRRRAGQSHFESIALASHKTGLG